MEISLSGSGVVPVGKPPGLPDDLTSRFAEFQVHRHPAPGEGLAHWLHDASHDSLKDFDRNSPGLQDSRAVIDPEYMKDTFAIRS